MTSSINTTIRRTGLLLVAALLGSILAGSALAGNSSGSNQPPQAAIKASSANWAAKAKLLDVSGRLRTDPFAHTAAIDAASANWAAKAKLLDVNGQLRTISTPPPTEAIAAASANWAAKAKLLDANGQLLPQARPTGTGDDGFNWGDFGIGTAAMLGLVLLAGGLLAGAHYSRRSTVRTRPAS